MNKITKATIGLILVTVISKILGFGREIVLGNLYGATMYSDVYIVAMNIPGTLFSLIGTAIGTTFIPLYYENYNLGGKKKAIEFTNNILNIVFILGILLSVMGFLFAQPLVKIFAMGFEAEEMKLAIKFTRIMIAGTIFMGISGIMSSFLQVNEDFIIPGLIGIPYNLIIIISIILSVKINIYILPIGTLFAMISRFIFQVPFSYNKGYKYDVVLNIKDEYVKKIIWLVAPVLIGVSVNQVNTMLDRTIASTLVEGSISALNYANRLNGFVMGLFIATLTSVIYPMLSRLSVENDKKKFTESIVNSINSIVLLVIPISVGAIVLANPIVKLLFQRGAFDESATSMTAIALVFYSIGMVGFGLRDILGKVFYSLQDTKTPMVNGAISMVINIVLNLIIVKFMGHAGLALATSISGIICILLLFRSLKKKIGYFGQDKIMKTTIKSLISAIVMGIVTYIMYNVLANILGIGFIQETIALLVSIGIGALVYGVLVIVLKVEELSMITNIIKKKITV